MMARIENIWVNVGRSQFHLPTREAQVLRGTIGLLLPDLKALPKRLRYVGKQLEGTQFSFREASDTVEATCPWGNRFRCHAPDPARFGHMRLGMPYVEFDVPQRANLAGIQPFHGEIFEAVTGMASDQRGAYAGVRVGDGNHQIFRENQAPVAAFDGHLI
jgi:hypothetical protein